jgi:DNA-binding transcriptional LysR family regulator
MDRLTSLNVFVQVADQGGFSAAARRLNISTTMASAHIQALENRLGVRLFNRTTRKVSLTEVGKTYRDSCEQILRELEEADNIASALQTTPRGTLRLYTSANVVPLIAPVISEYLSSYPDVSVDFSLGERMVDMVDEGFDLAISTIPLPDSSLIIRRLTPWRHILCCAPSYLVSHGAPSQLQDLTHHNCLRYSYYPFGDDWHFADPNGKNISVRVSGSLKTHSGEALRVAALSGVGLFLAPSFVAAQDVKAGQLVRLLPDYEPVEFAINAVYPHRHQLSAKVRIFIDLLATHFAEHRRWMNPGPAR